jgi:hypothetical protein
LGLIEINARFDNKPLGGNAMRINQNEATTVLQSRRTFLMVTLFSAAAAIGLGAVETEAAPITGAGVNPADLPVDKEMAQREMDRLAKTVGQDDRVLGAYGRYGHYRRVTRRVYRRSYRRTRRYVRGAYRRSYYY